MPIGDLFRIIDRQLYEAQVCENVFYYTVTNDPGLTASVADLLANFETGVLNPMLDIQSVNVQHTELYCENVQSLTQFATVATPGAVGTRTGDSLNSFTAWGFRLNRSSRLSHNGAKRIVGVAESDIVDGVATGTIVALLTSWATDYAATIVSGSCQYVPCIVRFDPLTHAMSLVWPNAGAEYVRVTTQNTRKIGRGI